MWTCKKKMRIELNERYLHDAVIDLDKQKGKQYLRLKTHLLRIFKEFFGTPGERNLEGQIFAKFCSEVKKLK